VLNRKLQFYRRLYLPACNPINMTTEKFSQFFKVDSVDEQLGIVFGWAMICTEDGKPYFDLQDDHIPEHSMTKALADFMENLRVAKDMHVAGEAGVLPGSIIFGFPLTADIAKSMGISTRKTGAIIGMKPGDPEVLRKFASGEYTGFSIGGERLLDEEAD
jgi:hypothetical protein